LIVFGRPIEMLGTGEQVSLARRAASMAAGFIASPLTDSLAQALNLDELQLDLPASTLAPSLTVAEQFAEGVYLRLEQQFGPASRSTATLEYRLADWARIEAEINQGDLEMRPQLQRAPDRGMLQLLFTFGF
jgi:autotransporter translocation and assembly factor TamB